MRYLLSLFFFIPTSSLWAISIAGIIEASFIQTHYDEVWLNSWQNSGVGLTRFDKESDQLELTQALLEFDFDLA